MEEINEGRYDIPSKDVYEILVEAGVTHLYHANSVITSWQFLRERALLSRGTVEQRGFLQTSQYTDKDDKAFSIWFDIFMDSDDIHARAKKINMYGPVLFKFGVELRGC